MRHAIAPLPFKPPRLQRLCRRTVDHHYEGVYGAAVRQLNALTAGPVIDEQTLTLANAVALHELYFAGLGGEGGLGGPTAPPPGPLAVELDRAFGSLSRWQETVVEQAGAPATAEGWLVLSWSPRYGELHMHATDGTAGCLADGVPLLALDLHDHARAGDVTSHAKAWLADVHWRRPAARLDAALARNPGTETDTGEHSIAVESLSQLAASSEPVVILDVCIADDLPERHDTLPGARCVMAESLADWAQSLPTGAPVVAFCMYGYQVSQGAAAALRAMGVNARYLRGGISAWRAMGGGTEPYPTTDDL